MRKYEFQFHTGSIKSRLPTGFVCRCISFNSILVRLKVVYPISSLSAPEGFKFHTGSIKVISLGSSGFVSGSFQFHTGSIKSERVWEPYQRVTEFQFHTGSIKRLYENH